MSVHETAGRVPPHAFDVEQSVVGALLLDRHAPALALGVADADAFYDGRHQRIVAAVSALFERGAPTDMVAVTQELRRRGDLDAVNPVYLAELTGRVASAGNVEYHARLVRERAILRRFIEASTLLVGKAYDPATDAFDLLGEAAGDVAAILAGAQGAAGGFVPVGDLFDDYERALELPRVPPLPTGVGAYSALLGGGYERSCLHIVAARTSMGKSVVALQAAKASASAGFPSAYMSLEMPRKQCLDRLTSAHAGVEVARIHDFMHVHPAERHDIRHAIRYLRALPIHIDDTARLSIEQVVARVKVWATRVRANGHTPGTVVVDYLQLIDGRDARNRNLEVASVSRRLKQLAKEEDVPVVALSQVPRAVENRADKRPLLSDLAESSGIEADADTVTFLYRPEYYDELVDDHGNDTRGIVEIIARKVRQGSPGTRRAVFEGRFNRITDHAHVSQREQDDADRAHAAVYDGDNPF